MEMEMTKYGNGVWSVNMPKESNERVMKMTKYRVWRVWKMKNYERKGYNLRNSEDKNNVAEGWYMQSNESVGFSAWDLTSKLDKYGILV
jgi:hypothetical protein